MDIVSDFNLFGYYFRIVERCAARLCFNCIQSIRSDQVAYSDLHQVSRGVL
jgi:hypothetical protein